MNSGLPDDLGNRSLLELFLVEAETQTALLTSGLLELELGPPTPLLFTNLMRAAHSLKGAARIVNLQSAASLAHALEDCFVAAQRHGLQLTQTQIDSMFVGVDLLTNLAKRTENNLSSWETEHRVDIKDFVQLTAHLFGAQSSAQSPSAAKAPLSLQRGPRSRDASAQPTPGLSPVRLRRNASPTTPTSASGGGETSELTIRKAEPPERVVRLAAESLNRLLGLASEALIESRWLRPFAESLQRLKRQQMALTQQVGTLRHSHAEQPWFEHIRDQVDALYRQIGQSQHVLAERIQELDLYDRRSAHLTQRLYLEALRTRMRSFNDGVRRFPRMVRDLARALGKTVRLEIQGENTQVDRDILERLESPLAHLIRNAVDHGCETPEERKRAGKPPECALLLEARHSAGVLLVTVSDDGAGVDLERLRSSIVSRGLATHAVAKRLTEQELLDFLFLPGFTLKETVTEISGRGFGLDVAQNMAKSVRGSIRLSNQPGRGLRVQLQLPLTLSVLRALLVEVAGEPYAIPLNQILRTLTVPRTGIDHLGGRSHFHLSEEAVVLLSAHQVLECGQPRIAGAEIPVVMLGERHTRYGLAVDKFLGERELVVQPLDPRLGKIADISAAALMEDGAPVLIIDVEETIGSIERLLAEGRLANVQPENFGLTPPALKRVLAVDDSLTVRELQRKLLSGHGYEVEVASDGLEAWNALCSGDYDLVITDIDMPRMTGIELAALIKKGPHPKSVPVLILSYKDGDDERERGLQAGADCYLTKGSFHDETLLQAVTELIGGPDA